MQVTSGRERVRFRGRTVVGMVLGTLLLWPAAGVALAHVALTSSSTAAGSSAVLTFAFAHGCAESPTTALAIQIPDEFVKVAPTVKQGWTVKTVMEPLATPVDDGHGGQYTERVAQIAYTAEKPVPDGLRETFELALTLPEDATDKTIAFPVVQTCSKGENAWIQLAAEGQDTHDLDSPAPTLTVTAATGERHDSVGASPTGHDHDDPAETAGPDGWTVAALVLGALALAVGGLGLVRHGRP